MNSIAIIPFLAAACFAAPGGIVHPGLVHTYAAAPALTYTHAIAPVAHVSVPVTKTVHYETKPVVTGYSTSIIKPAIPALPVPTLPLAVAAPQPIIAQQQVVQVAGNDQLRQIPNFPPIPDFPAFPGTNGSSDVPQTPPLPPVPEIPAFPGSNGSFPDVGDAPQLPPIPSPPSFPPQQQQQVQVQTFNTIISPIHVEQKPVAVAPAAPVAVADAEVIEARAAVPAPVPVPVAVQPAVTVLRAAQAGDFEPLVTKEKVLAPVRTHTQITPQITQVVPEVTVRKVVHDVPVAQPILRTPVHVQVASPVVAAAPALAYSAGNHIWAL